MTQFCFQNTSTNPINKKNNKLSNFATLILSQPLYLSYLIFFSPCILKILSFLCPLFITTSLLVLSLITTLIPLNSVLNSKDSFFLTLYNTLVEKLSPEIDNEGEGSKLFEEFEVFKNVFEAPIIEEIGENPDEIKGLEENPHGILAEKPRQLQKSTDEIKGFEENPDGILAEKAPQLKKLTVDQCENLINGFETGDPRPNKVKEEVKKYESLLSKKGSEVNKVAISEDLKHKIGSFKVDEVKKLSEAFSQTAGSPPYLGSFGSIRKEREWRRTLACKLFEERHNWCNKNGVNVGDNEEGMDLLWEETYETEQIRGKSKEGSNKNGRRRERTEDLMVVKDDEDDGDGDGDDDNGKFCCLQALKLSAGKMNLNMGRPSLIKIGKTFKGFGWLQSSVRRQAKKRYK